ncbi:MAG: ATP-binding protein, partial [Brachybacterium sp.]|nr:ATP-binding protein [Brachybacterium sp.]
MTNPFTPGFGVAPPILAIAGTPVEDFRRALAAGGGAGRQILISGMRGTGKTVLLTQLRVAAHQEGWESIRLHTASEHMAGSLRASAAHLLRGLDPEATTSHLTAASGSALGFGGSAGRDIVDRYEDIEEPLHVILDRLTGLLGERGGGLMIAVDEIQAADPPQLHEIAQHVQTLVEDARPVSFVGAGLRSGVEDLLTNPSTTFLRRAHRVELEVIDVGSAASTIEMTAAEGGKTMTADAAREAGDISQGYQYLMQLIGAGAYDAAGDGGTIGLEQVREAELPAVAEVIKNVHGPALRGISARKMDYLVAMSEDEGPSTVADIAERMGVDVKYQSVYRDRLLKEDLIRAAGVGLVEYSLPYLREAIIDKAAGGTRYA